MHAKNVILMSLILHNIGLIHASHLADIQSESNDRLSPSCSNFVTRNDQIETITNCLYQPPSVYEDSVFNVNEASRALLTGQVNGQIIDKQIILDLYWKESIAGSAEIQEKLYNFLSKSFGASNFINADKANELLNIALSQKQTWAYRQQGMIQEQKGNKTLALKNYIFAAHRHDEQSQKKANILLGYDPKTIMLHPQSSLEQKKSYIKKWEKLGYGIPLYDYFQKYADRNSEFFDHSFIKKSADLGYIAAKYGLGFYQFYIENDKKGLSLLIEAANEGHAESQEQVAELLFHKLGNQSGNKKKALEYCKKAANQGLSSAQYNTGIILLKGFEDQKSNQREALKFFLKAARQGHIKAFNNIGVILIEGFEGQAPNHKEALYWFNKAAEQGSEIAQFYMGSILSKKYDDLSPDYEQALHYYHQAAQKNFAPALINAAFMLFNRKNPEDDQKALKYFKQASKTDKGRALYGMGIVLKYGVKHASDNSEIYKYFSQAISDPNINAEFKSKALIEMGHILKEGFKGQKPNPTKALECYLEAARQNSPRAQHIVAIEYLKQEDNALNDQIALDFLLQAAHQNYTRAIITLADYYIMIEDDASKALFWLEKAQSLKEPLADQHLKLIDSAHLSTQNMLSNTEEEIKNLLETSFQPEKQSQSDLLNTLKSDNIIKSENDLLIKKETFVSPDYTQLKEKQKIKSHENSDTLFHDDITDIFSADTVSPKNFSLAISNPKYIREQMKKLGDLKKSYTISEDFLPKALASKNQEIVEKIKDPTHNNFNFKDLEKLFQDPYFSGQVIMYETRSGKMISAHNKVTGDHLTISTHRGHFKNVDHDISKAFVADISKILGIFDL